MENTISMSSAQLLDLMTVLISLAMVCGAFGGALWRLVEGLITDVVDAIAKRVKPPSPTSLRAIARGMRKRAAQLDMQADKASPPAVS